MIVFEDANIPRAAAGALWGGLTTLGQSCTSVERIYVQRPIFEEFKNELIRLAEAVSDFEISRTEMLEAADLPPAETVPSIAAEPEHATDGVD